jgi:hypothetical protein
MNLEKVVETAVERAVFGSDLERREFVKLVGAGTASAILGSVFPLDAAKALAQEKLGPPEKKDLKVGFIPITCATPIIMAEPMGFYKKHGLNVQVVKASGWAMIRDLSINKETDATHMLTPMPLAISMGVGSQTVPYVMPAVENINGQAITLANKHKGVKSAKEMKGFKLAVPFDYSMHNFLLRYVVAEAGLDPDKDIQIRVVPPPEMVANLRAGNLDGYLGRVAVAPLARLAPAHLKALLINARGLIEGELHLGMIGAPALSVSLTSGLVASFGSFSKAESDKVPSHTSRQWALGLAGPTSLWGLVTNVQMRLYF